VWVGSSRSGTASFSSNSETATGGAGIGRPRLAVGYSNAAREAWSTAAERSGHRPARGGIGSYGGGGGGAAEEVGGTASAGRRRDSRGRRRGGTLAPLLSACWLGLDGGK
jgi:hypothetical protein